jgi:hypothetical protein
LSQEGFREVYNMVQVGVAALLGNLDLNIQEEPNVSRSKVLYYF